MIPADLPLNEAERLKVLNTYDVLDSLPEEDYDGITAIAASICGTPIALVSIIGKNKQWFKSHHGLAAKETPREFSFCAHSILNTDELFIINDATKDDRFANNPLTIGAPNVVFYAGAPLNSSEGFPLGTLCVIDNKPNALNKRQQQSLKLLAKQVVNLLELRKKNKELLKSNEEVLRLNSQLNEFSYRLSHDIKTPISGIKYLSEVIRIDYANKLDEEGRVLLNLISSRSSYLFSLVEGMLNFTKVTNAKIIFESFNFEELLERIKVSCRWEDTCETNYIGCNVLVKQSRVAFIQVFQNLFSNSIKFVGSAKAIISISLEIDSDSYKIIYKDNGFGIDKKYHKKVFDLFETLGSKNGTGIGLPTVSAILKRLGGSIQFQETKENGIGVLFSLIIPIIKN
jgi:signal transduction histidine kinase